MNAWTLQKLEYLKNNYSGLYLEWLKDNHTDRRRVYCMLYEMAMQSVNEIDDTDDVSVRRVINGFVRKTAAMMDNIQRQDRLRETAAMMNNIIRTKGKE